MSGLVRCDCGVFINNAGACPNCGRGHYELNTDTRIRRRIEDLIRKDPVVLKKVAVFLNMK